MTTPEVLRLFAIGAGGFCLAWASDSLKQGVLLVIGVELIVVGLTL